MAGPAAGETRQRLLDVAERLFAEQSYEATSLRQLTAGAGTNLAAVHYHFGSKEALFRAVFARRVGPINTERLARLAELEARGAATLEALLVALFEPALRLAEDPDRRWFTRLVGRSFSEPGEHWVAADREFDDVRAQFGAAFARSLPHVSPEVVALRLFFTVGVQCIVLASEDSPRRALAGELIAGDPRRLLAEIVAYTAAGLRAPVA